MRSQLEASVERAGLGHHLVEADDDDAGVAGLLDRRVERRVGRRVDEDRVRLLADDVVQRIDLRLDGALGDLDVQLDAALERTLVDRHLGDALHLLAPVIADEIVGEIDDVGLLVLRDRRRRADCARRSRQRPRNRRTWC